MSPSTAFPVRARVSILGISVEVVLLSEDYSGKFVTSIEDTVFSIVNGHVLIEACSTKKQNH